MNFKLIICAILVCFLPPIKGECKQKKKVEDLSPSGQAKQSLLRNRQHLDLLNYLIIKNNYKSYLEIGVADGKNLQSVIVEHKVGVDPSPILPGVYRMTSDDFFKTNSETFEERPHSADGRLKPRRLETQVL